MKVLVNQLGTVLGITAVGFSVLLIGKLWLSLIGQKAIFT